MKFSVLLCLLGVLLAPTLAEENHGRDSGEGPRLPPPHEEGPRHPPHFEAPRSPHHDESPRHPPANEHPHYLFRPGYQPTRHHRVNRPHQPHRPFVPPFGRYPNGFAIRAPAPHAGNWKTVWDASTGFIATKVLGKNTCIISKADRGFNGFEGASSPGFLPPIEHRYVISNDRLPNLYPYGPRIQRLCRGVPTYFAFPSPGSNFSEDDDSCMTNIVNNMKFVYCSL
ncbi:uncharacterized protein [Excalfactoria chinensis]|uniref:uncharacterized protein n=1 Tax=Excalfactoria chinensis TaxID=46218 RepID=UPI003B3B1752